MFDFLTRGPLGIMLIALAAFYFMVVLPQQRSMKRQQAERAEALLNMKKNDRVVTAGGIHGVVVSVNKDEKTVTIRTDESTNSRLTINSDSVTIVDLTATKTD
jgi:preprotein translocase subunit YajC